jgi:hypothetical protein
MIEDLNKSVKFFEPQRRRDAENTIESSLRLRASAVKTLAGLRGKASLVV